MTIQSLFRAGLFQGEILFRVGLFRGRLCSGWAGGRIEKPSPAAGEIIQNRNTPPIVPGSRPDCSRVVEQRKPLILASCSRCSNCSSSFSLKLGRIGGCGAYSSLIYRVYRACGDSPPHLEQPGTRLRPGREEWPPRLVGGDGLGSPPLGRENEGKRAAVPLGRQAPPAARRAVRSTGTVEPRRARAPSRRSTAQAVSAHDV